MRRALLSCLLAACGVLATAAAAQESPARRVELRVAQGVPVGGPTVVKLVRGDEVELVVVADRADELHVHGVELHAQLSPGQPATLRFLAQRTGRFPIELHRAGVQLGALEVYPR